MNVFLIISAAVEIFRNNPERSINRDKVLVGGFNLLDDPKVNSNTDDAQDAEDDQDNTDSEEDSTEAPVELPLVVPLEGSLSRPEGVGGPRGPQRLRSVPDQRVRE